MAVPAVGEVFAGKYVIEAVVGRGGMGVVLAARHLELDERVAIKLILTEDGVKSAEFVARFVREAKLASKIKSEHVVRVLDVARLESGEPYIVMELLEGRDLAELLQTNGPLPIEQASLYVLQACEAIAEAHALGIVHRDLKPANLFVTTLRDGRACVKVLDFGISKQLGEAAGLAMTQTNALMGSPMYMSPDQLVQARDIDARSDVWALGIILFELLSGRTPFEGEDAPQLITQILHRPAPSLLVFRPNAPPELAALIARALEKNRHQRIPDVAALSRGLVAFAPEIGRYSVERISGLLARSATAAGGMSATRTSMQLDGLGSGAIAAGTPSATASGASVDLRGPPKSSSPWPRLAVLIALIAVVGGVGARYFVAGTPPRLASTAGTPAAPAGSATEASRTPPLEPPAVPPLPHREPAPEPTTAAVVDASPPSKAPTARTKGVRAAPRAAQSAPAKPPVKAGITETVDPFGGVR